MIFSSSKISRHFTSDSVSRRWIKLSTSKVVMRRRDPDAHRYQLSAPTGGYAFNNDGTVPADYWWHEDELCNMGE